VSEFLDEPPRRRLPWWLRFAIGLALLALLRTYSSLTLPLLGIELAAFFLALGVLVYLSWKESTPSNKK